MTKQKFSKFYRLFTILVKQEVNNEYVMCASCHFIDHCGGYELQLRPECLMWGSEFALMQALCDRLSLSFEVHMSQGLLTIR